MVTPNRSNFPLWIFPCGFCYLFVRQHRSHRSCFSDAFLCTTSPRRQSLLNLILWPRRPSLNPLQGRIILKYELLCWNVFAGCICPFHTSDGVTEVTDHFDSNWTPDCCAGVTAGKRGKQVALSPDNCGSQQRSCCYLHFLIICLR